MLTPHTLFPSFQPLKCLCLDAEFASSRDVLEMLELTMLDSEGAVIYNHRFRPARIRRWNLIPHNITSAMVEREPSFATCRPSIQRLLDGADYLVGFAIDNDLRRLEAQGTGNLDTKRIIEIRDWFWHLYGRDHGLDYSREIGLARCCSELGVDLDPDKAHSAAYDTAVTLRCFHILLEMYVATRQEPFGSFDTLYDTFIAEFTEAKDAYDLEAAKGYCALYSIPDDRSFPYRFVAGREAPDPTRAGLIASIQVANRRKAVIDLSSMLVGTIATTQRFKLRRLTSGMIKRFKRYTNTADIEELRLARSLMKLSSSFPQSGVRH